MRNQSLWEILVPVRWSNGLIIDVERHKEWDKRCREISNGMTILRPAKGFWNNEGEEHIEEMLPVRLLADEEQIRKLAYFTKEFYRQTQVMFYKLSDEVYFV